MWNNANHVLSGAGGEMLHWEHMGWSWFMGFDGFAWLLTLGLVAAFSVAIYRFTRRKSPAIANVDRRP